MQHVWCSKTNLIPFDCLMEALWMNTCDKSKKSSLSLLALDKHLLRKYYGKELTRLSSRSNQQNDRKTNWYVKWQINIITMIVTNQRDKLN
jgi:hypothetical protein